LAGGRDDPNAILTWTMSAGPGNTVQFLDVTADHVTRFLDRNFDRTQTVLLRKDGAWVMIEQDGKILARVPKDEFAFRYSWKGAPPNVAQFQKWFARTSNAFSFASGAYNQWHKDEGILTGERATRAAVAGGLIAGGAWAGAKAGGAIGAGVCSPSGPGAAACALGGGIVGGFIGGVAGGFAGGKVADWANESVPGLKREDTKPGAHYDDEVTSAIANEDGDLLEPLDGLRNGARELAEERARAETADRPDVASELNEMLRPPAPPTGTTTTTTVKVP
jgi:hypothetical protein